MFQMAPLEGEGAADRAVLGEHVTDRHRAQFTGAEADEETEGQQRLIAQGAGGERRVDAGKIVFGEGVAGRHMI